MRFMAAFLHPGCDGGTRRAQASFYANDLRRAPRLLDPHAVRRYHARQPRVATFGLIERNLRMGLPSGRCVALLTALLVWLAARSAQAEDWPRWRGPRQDGISQETGLLPKWPEGG